MPFDSGSFDLITCFGTLHHIPNVSFVFSEMARCLKAGCYMLVRETTTSMGDWRKPRPGLTKRERGIPPRIFDQIVAANGLTIVARHPCMNRMTYRLQSWIGRSPFNSPFLVRVDALFSLLFRWNRIYHTDAPFLSVRNTSAYYVLRKPECSDGA
jgi:SAM-dependent methyltransferase